MKIRALMPFLLTVSGVFNVPACVAGALPGPSKAQTIEGQFALQGQDPKTEAHLKVAPVPGKPLTEQLDFWMTKSGSAAPITNYQIEMTQPLHMIIVSSDFKHFYHEHPKLTRTGHMLLTHTFSDPGSYLVYSDALPNNLNHQVFRFAVNVDSAASGPRVLQPTGMAVKAGPYEVDISSVRLHAGTMSMLDVVILKDGKPATDLHPYLGVPAHAVFLNAQDLSYVHVHPMTMEQMGSMDMSKEPPPLPEAGPSPSEMMLHISLKQTGNYKMWLQFRGGQQLYVAEFTVNSI